MRTEDLLQQSDTLARGQERLTGDKNRVARMQPGEDPSSRLSEDAVHWSAVYEELITFKERLLAEVENKIEEADEPAVGAELGHDRDILRFELRRLRLHHAFWAERVGQPSPAEAS